MNTNLTDNTISYRHRCAPKLSSMLCEQRDPEPTDGAGRSVAAERIEAAGRLAAWLAHQINNPLGAISGNAQLLARRLQRDIEDPESLQAYLRHLEAIHSQIERCTRITGDALSFTEPGDPDFQKLDAREVVSEALELVEYAHPDGKIVFDEKKEKTLPAIKADREWLARVIFELTSNAIEVSCERPIKVEVDTLTGRGKRVEAVLIKVTDSGPGISEELRTKVFDPFYSSREKARGLGLTLSLEMMRRMGGSLQIEKSDSAGSVFTVGIAIWGTRD